MHRKSLRPQPGCSRKIHSAAAAKVAAAQMKSLI